MSGLVSGFLIGFVLDSIAVQKYTEWRIKRFQKAQTKQFIREHLIGNLYALFGKLCAADGTINEKEKVAALDIATKVFSLDTSDKAYALKVLREAPRSPQAIQTSAVRLYEMNSENPATLETSLELCFEVAAADGAISSEELSILEQISSVFGISKDQFQRISNMHISSTKIVGNLAASYAILGCSKSDSDTTIKKSYRKLLSDYHPDKIVSKNLPEDFVAFANQKVNSIKEAYEAVKSAREIAK